MYLSRQEQLFIEKCIYITFLSLWMAYGHNYLKEITPIHSLEIENVSLHLYFGHLKRKINKIPPWYIITSKKITVFLFLIENIQRSNILKHILRNYHPKQYLLSCLVKCCLACIFNNICGTLDFVQRLLISCLIILQNATIPFICPVLLTC